jgi:mitochondrial fission protein ELM1
MTPSVLGTAPFDFAVVPEHDHPQKRDNVLPTLGAPNAIFPDELERQGWELAQKYPPRESGVRENRWESSWGATTRITAYPPNGCAGH